MLHALAEQPHTLPSVARGGVMSNFRHVNTRVQPSEFGKRTQLGVRKAEIGVRSSESGDRSTESGDRSTESGDQSTEFGKRSSEHGKRSSEYGKRRSEYGVPKAELGARKAENGARCPGGLPYVTHATAAIAHLNSISRAHALLAQMTYAPLAHGALTELARLYNFNAYSK